MVLITIREAAKRFGCDERTIRRWIAKGSLRAVPGANGHPALAVSDVEALASSRATDGSPDLQAMQERLEALERRVSELEQAQPYKQIAPPVRVIRNTYEQESVTSSPESPASLAGYIHLNELAQEIGRSRGALYDQVKKGTYHAVETPKANRPRERDWWFSPEEAQRVRADYGK